MIDKLGYLGNPKLKNVSTRQGYTEEQVIELSRCADDIFYFIKNYIKIRNVDEEGLIPLNLRSYQEKLIKAFCDERFVICKFPRQYGKSTSYVAYILHYLIFHNNVEVALLANKGQTARELLSRIQVAWENLPIWMQQGIVVWNKGSIELENGSKIIATNTASNSIRGYSFNCIVLDEFAHIDNNLAEEFFRSTYPAISSGKTTKVFIVSTPKGMNLYWKLWMEATKPPKEKTSKFSPVEVHWTEFPGHDENWRLQEIANLGSEAAFDQEYGTEFLGSDDTLISGSKLRQLSFSRPITSQAGLDIFQEPIVDTITDDMGLTTRVPHKYVLCADTAQGKELDYSALIVVDVTEIPYKIVAKYKNNTISTIIFPDVIYDVARRYNNAYVLIEINDGRDVAQGLHYDLEYENILTCTTKGRAGQILSSGYSKNPQFGLKMTTPVKKIGCANLKSLIEMDKLLLIDADIIAELATFVRQGNTFKADLETGAHDDLVMCMVIFSWLVQQKYFKELLESDIRSRMRDEMESQLIHDMLPFGIISDGREEQEPEVIAGDVWYNVESIWNWTQ